MGNQTAVTFLNRNGLRLFGVLHSAPGRGPADLVVLLLSPGVKMRVGPERLYLRMTERFLELGLSVLRFDFHGLGDSEGTLPEERLRDVYSNIELGRYVDDSVDAMNWMEQTYGCRRFLLSGLCGGAITALLAGGRDKRVAGVHGLGMTAVLAAPAADQSRYMTIGQVEAQQAMYLRRLLSPDAWFRLLTLKTDIRLIRRMLDLWLRKLVGRKREAPVLPPPDGDNANPLFPPAFFNMVATRRPMLFVFGGGDRLHWEYQEKFVARHREQLASMPTLVHEHVVQAANHVLSLREWQDEMLDVSTRWLNTHFRTDLVDRASASGVAIHEASHS